MRRLVLTFLLLNGLALGQQQIDLVTQTKNVLPTAKGGTGAVGPFTANRCVQTSPDGSTFVTAAAACGSGGGGSSEWSAILAPTANLSLSMGTFTTGFTWGNYSGAGPLFDEVDGSGSTSTGYLRRFRTGTSSTMKPLGVFAQGTANGVEVTSAGRLQAVGTGSNSATHLQGRLFSTTAPNDGQLPIWNNSTSTWVPGDPIVSGPAAEGATPANNPVWVAGTGTDGFVRALRLFDLDSGAGSQWTQGVNLRKIASGGSVELGTATDPLRVDTTGTTTQPISAASLPLPSGAATEATLAARLAESTFTTRINTQGQKTMAASTPVVLASDQSAIPVTGSGTFTTDQVSSAEADYDTGAPTVNQTMFGIALPGSGGPVAGGTTTNPLKVDPTGTTTQPVSDAGGSLTVDAPVGTPVAARFSDGSAFLTTTGGRLAVDPSGVTSPVSIAATVNVETELPAGAAGTPVHVRPSDGTSAQTFLELDLDSGAGTQNRVALGVAGAASGGAVAITATGTSLNVNCTGGCVAGGSFSDNAAFTFGSTAIGPTGFVVDDTATNTVTENSAGAPRMSTNRIAYSALRDAAGNEVITATAAPGASDRALVVREARVGQAAMTASFPVVIASDQSKVTTAFSQTTTDNNVDVDSLPANASVNLNQVAGAAVATAASGIAKVGIVGNTGAAVDGTVAPGTAPVNQVTVGLQYKATAPSPTDTQTLAMQADEEGNLKVTPGMPTATLSAWTSATGVNATQNFYTNSGVGAVLAHLVQTSTITAGAITFEVTYDGTNWVTIPADAVLDPASTTFAQISLPYTLQASTNKPFLLMGKGWQGLRIKLSTAITGTGSVTPNYALPAYEPAKSVIALSPVAGNFNVTTTPPANASTNVSQFGGSAVVTGTGAGGAGIPRVTISNDSSLAANQSVNVAQVGGTATVTGGVAGSLGVGGLAALDAVVAGSPLYVGSRASDVEPTAVSADGDAVNFWLSRFGHLVIYENFVPAVATDSGAGATGPKTVTLTLTSDAALVAAPAASTSIYVTGLSCSNTSATNTRVDIKDGTTSRYSMFLAASGGGFVHDNWSPPWKITAATALNAALGTAVTDVRCNVHYYVAP